MTHRNKSLRNFRSKLNYFKINMRVNYCDLFHARKYILLGLVENNKNIFVLNIITNKNVATHLSSKLKDPTILTTLATSFSSLFPWASHQHTHKIDPFLLMNPTNRPTIST
jgi:hypothetical protein